MSKIIAISSASILYNLMQRLTDAYDLRERLIYNIAEYNKLESKKPNNATYKLGKELVEVMGKPAVDPQLDIDEIVAVAECRIKKANVTIHEAICRLKADYDIQIEDQR